MAKAKKNKEFESFNLDENEQIVEKLYRLFSQGYEIGEIGETYISSHGPDTRFVIMEKYPEKRECNVLNVTFQMVKKSTVPILKFEISDIKLSTIKTENNKDVRKQIRRRKRI